MSAGLADARGRRAAWAVSRDAGAARITALIAREGDALLAYFARRVEPREDAADLLSETFAVLWRRAAALPPGEEAERMWAYGVARRVLATHRRGQGRRSALLERLRTQLGGADSEGPQTTDPRAEHAAELVRALPTPDREIVMLLHWDGFTLAGIAQLLDMPAGTVRSRYARTRAALKAQLEASFE